MTTGRKIALSLVALAGVLLVAAILLVPVYFNPDRYRPDVIAYFEANTGKKAELGRLSLTLFPKTAIHIEGFSVKSPPLFPPGYILKLARADAEIDGWALVHRNLIIKSLVVEDAEINLISDPDGPWNFENPENKSAKNTFPLTVIDKVVVKGGKLTVSNLLPSDAPGPVFLEAHDITSELDNVDLAAIVNPASPALSGRGSWKAARMRFGKVETTNLTARIRLESREIFLTDVRADTLGGKATGDFSVSVAKRKASFKADARISGISMDQLLAAFHETRGRMTGTLEGDMKLAGEIEHSVSPLAGLHGAGHVKVTDGAAPTLELNANLMRLLHFNDLGPAKENPASFASISMDWELANLVITSKAIDFDGYGVDVDALGSVNISGSDELDYQGTAAITTKQGFFTNTFARLEGAKLIDGKLTFPFRIEGTIDNPKFSKGAKNK